MSRKPYFLPYQEAWLKDDSRLKIAEKSRRIGWTYVQAYEDVRDAAKAQGGMDVWFSSADLSAAREYIRYVEQWARLFDTAARSLGEILINEEDDIKALVVEFSNGKRIHALSSNPKAFRSKGGKVVLDEFAFHDNPDELWKAASPSVLWGYPIRVFSSHNGKNTRFYRMVQQAKQGNGWSLHTVTIEDAIQDGLVEKIKGLDRPATQDEIAEFVQECKNIAGDEETYQQEFMCNPQDDKEAYFPWSLIYANESPVAPGPVVILGQEVNDAHEADYRLPWEYRPEPGRRHFLGVDVGRNKDLTVMWLYELVGDVLWTRLWLKFHGVRFALQRKNLYALLEFVSRACIDSTGLGMQLAEEAQERYGAKVEPVNFSNALKVDLSVTYKRKLEDRLLRNPEHEAFRNDVNKIKREVTAGGYVRFVGERDENGHADRYWGAALAVHAAGNLSGPVEHEQLGAGPRFKRRGTY
jgi:phage FluMu gp28-like protein